MDLKKIGWNNYFEESFKEFKDNGYYAGRVSSEHRNMYKIITEMGEVSGEISGKMRFKAEEGGDYPAVGDFVVISFVNDFKEVIIHDILPRRSKFSRKEAGKNIREQIAAANVDIVFLVCALNNDFNLRRIERYLIVAWESGAAPVIILSKADLCEDLDEKLREVEKIAIGVPIHIISSYKKEGIELLYKYFEGNKTVVLLGSSGVGKSTLINELLGQNYMDTKEISMANGKGQHTTTYRQIIVLEGGGAVIDTPGMRELQLWEGNDGISGTFEDIDELSGKCQFSDCKHQREPNCAIKTAIRDGILSEERFENYIKMKKELKFIEAKQRHNEMIASKKQRRANNRETDRRNFKNEDSI